MVLDVDYSASPVSVPTASGSEVTLVSFINYTVIVTNDHKLARESHYTYFAGLISREVQDSS